MPLAVSVVQVIRGRIIKIDRQLHQPEPKHACIEVNIRLRFAGDCCYVMKSFNTPHCLNSFRLA